MTTEVTVTVLRRSRRALRLRRRVGVVGIARRPVSVKTFELEVIGRNRISIDLSLDWSFPVAEISVPVPVLGIPLVVEGGLASSLSLSASVPSWRGRASFTLSGSIGISGSLGLGVGVPGVSAGVEGALDLLKASIPATTTITSRGLTYYVRYVVESAASINLYAKVGWGWFSKKASVTVFKWTLWRVEIPVVRATLEASS